MNAWHYGEMFVGVFLVGLVSILIGANVGFALAIVYALAFAAAGTAFAFLLLGLMPAVGWWHERREAKASRSRPSSSRSSES